MESLWGQDFTITETPKAAKKILNKIANPKTPKEHVEKLVSSSKIPIKDKLVIIYENVLKILGVYKDNTVVIKTRQQLHEYIDAAILNKVIAIDTETNNSLDPITCKLMGPCIYTPGQKNAYIPINHVDVNTGVRLDWQLTESDIKDEFSRLANTLIIVHNGKFDYEVLKCTTSYIMNIYWDTLVGAKVLDENEMSAGLKQQYISKIDPSIEKYDIEKLFKDIEYAVVDPEIFALYAATDAYMTYKLFKYQEKLFMLPDNAGIYNLFKNVEMPLVTVLAEMQMRGMEVDLEYGERLSKKHHTILDTIDTQLKKELQCYASKIALWRETDAANYKESKVNRSGEPTLGKSKNEQLPDEINFSSPTQLAILLYDILEAPIVNKKQPRGTGEDDLKAIADKLHLSLCDLILQRRECVKLLSTYIDVIPELAKRWPDGRVRTHFNQYGAATGRLSSSDPLNFQNIPAHEKTIRMLFKAKDNYRIVGGDYSAQEPRLCAFYSGDTKMIQAYKDGKDLYAVIASASFNKPYEECLEFYPEGTKIMVEGKEVICGHKTHQNKEGKQRRSAAKSILLGILYGRGAASVAEQIGKSREEAQDIIDKFYTSFPQVKQWIDRTIADAHKNGYVEDIAGRRRRLPDILLPKYSIKPTEKLLADSSSTTFNPLLDCTLLRDDTVQKLIDLYKIKVAKTTYRNEYEAIKRDALSHGIEIKDNTGFIAQAERQAVNSRVQGGAATLTKVALINLYNNEELRSLGAYLINTVHDEILLEVPVENADKAAELLVSVMIESAKKYVPTVPMKCDDYVVTCWYIDEFFVLIENKFKKMLETMTDIEAFEKLCEEQTESTRDQLYEIVHGYMQQLPEGITAIA